MRGKKIIGLLLSVVTLIFMVACLLFFQANKDYEAQKGIEEAIKAYSATMKEQEIKVLTGEINNAVDKKLKEIDTGNMTDEELQDLMLLIVQKLEKATSSYRESDITQDEVYRIASQIVRKTMEEQGNKLNEEQLAWLNNYQKQLELLIKRQDSLDDQMEQTRNSLSDQVSQLEKAQGSKITGLSVELTSYIKVITEEIKKELHDTFQRELDEVKGKLQLQSEKLGRLEGSILYYEYEPDTHTLKLFGK